ncbi:TetR-like C-terminal domain-containing protein [Streptomyces ipomoeae]|uniref:TetR-like C-terminal domain-containing protein n=1 Tax=Streptomyces ipomoeae TaxID=103232 RepID=UPI001FD5FC90|nr:TetR-like C-terminal domain-containing protein [Streptomyces ipomoeae]MDX2939624.1 TetR-like C-terminal domain-containing protein [Streptomyces ipomoeae]
MRVLYDAIAETLDSPRWLIAARCSFEFPDFPELYAAFQRDCIEQPLAVIEDVLHDAQRRGELRPGVNRSVVAETFAASITHFSTHIADLRGVLIPGLGRSAISVAVRDTSAPQRPLSAPELAACGGGQEVALRRARATTTTDGMWWWVSRDVETPGRTALS